MRFSCSKSRHERCHFWERSANKNVPNSWKYTSQSVISTTILSVCLLFTMFSFANCNEAIRSQSPDVPSTKTVCIIGHLRECLEDEDCLENSSPSPNVTVLQTSLKNRNSDQSILNTTTLISKPSGQLYGHCVCRNGISCKRLAMEQNRRSPKSNPMIDDGSDDSHRQNHRFSAGWFFGAICIIVALGSISFLVYYYGFRYGMFRYYARQFGFVDNTQVEHQLLNRISTEDGTELQI